MAVVANKRSIMTLYAGTNDPYSHRARIVLAEKGVIYDLIEVDPSNKPQELLEVNPYGSVPTLLDRDLVLYNSEIIMEYLDERFPHPPLMPVYPVARARSRLMIYRINKDWYEVMNTILTASRSPAEKARKELKDSILGVAPLFHEMPYFLSEEFSLVDCCLAPLLWRLKSMGIELPKEAKAIEVYAKRLFERETFRASLTETERAMGAL
jgi:RNA polymerase-associated protein